MPLNPEWRWQCDYPGFPAGSAYPQTYSDPSALCNGFRWTPDHRLDTGNNCSNEISGTDTPRDPVWKAICHFIPDFPYQEPDQTVHGHVNWRPVTYEGAVKLERVQNEFPYGDGDTDLDLSPATATGPQNYTPTPPGVTWENPSSIHIEFTTDEVLRAFSQPGDQVGASWSAALAGLGGSAHAAVPAVVVGLFGLDARHASYSEVHPIYAIALREHVGQGYTKWMIFARNRGDEGGCSSHNPIPFKTTGIAMTLPLPDGTKQLSTDGSRYDSYPSGHPGFSVTSSGSVANVTVGLPPDGQDTVVAGELILRASPTAGPPPSALLPSTAQAPPHFNAQVPAKPQDPEDYLASLPVILSPSSSASALRVPISPARRPLPPAEACAQLRRNALTHPQDPVQLHLVQQICKAARQPFHP